MSTRKARAALVSVVLASCLSAGATAQSAWTELRGDHFVLRGGFDAGHLRLIACDVEQAVRALGFPQGVSSATVLPSIVAVANEKGTRELLPQFWERRGVRPVGAYWAGLYGHHIVVRVDARREERLRRLLHELAHFATHLAHPSPPRWLDEGLSEIWQHVAIGTGQIEIGRPVARHLRALRSDRNWIPIADLLSATAIPEGGGSRASMFYAQSWALVHYLLFETRNGKVLLDQLPEPGNFPTDQQLRRYARGKLAAPARVATAAPTSDCRGPLEVRSVPEVEALGLRARALADGERPNAALPLLDEALRLDTRNAGARETLGFVHFVGNRPRESAAAFDQVIATGEGSHIAYYYRAVLAARVPILSDRCGPVPELEYLRRAVLLSPGFRPALDRLRELARKFPGCASAARCATVSPTP